MKTVDKYQFNQDASFDQDVPSYVAIHAVLKKKYLVKMLTLGSDRDKESNNYLIRQSQMLKKIVDQKVYRCYKLLRSKNNFYAVYELIQGRPLCELLNQELPFQNKAFILKQLIQLLLELQSRNIVSMNISPNNIVVGENYKIVVKNFGMAEEFNNEQTEKVVESDRFKLSEYTPPEVKQGKIYRNTDLYSLGVLLSVLFASQFNKMETFKQRVALSLGKFDINASLSMQNLKNIATELTNKYSKGRKDLKELLNIKKPLLTVLPQKSQKCLNISRSTNNLSSSQQRKRQKIDNFDRLLQVILKSRGMSILFLKLSNALLINKQADLSTTIELSFMLVKKSTIRISQLAKLLSKGFNLQYFIQQKHMQVFQKQQTFKQFLDLINREMNQTQQRFQYMLKQIKKMPQLLQSEQLQHETKSESVSQPFLKKVLLQFLLQLQLIATKDYASLFMGDSLYYVFILSLVADFKSLQEIYESFFSEQVAQIKDQPFFKQIATVDKTKLVQLVQNNTSKLYSQTSGSFDLSVKTTRSPKMLKTKSFK